MNQGKELFDKAVEYLESQGFEHCDFSNYFLSGEEYEECGGIGLGWKPTALTLVVHDSLCANESSVVELSSNFEEIQKILDVLIFAIKLGEVDLSD